MTKTGMAIATIFMTFVGAIVGVAVCSWFWINVSIEDMTILTTVVVAGIVCLLNQTVYLSSIDNVKVGRTVYFFALALSIVASICQLDKVSYSLSLGEGWLHDGVSVACLSSGTMASICYLRYTCADVDNRTLVLAPVLSSAYAIGAGVAISIVCEIFPWLKPYMSYVAITIVNVALAIYMYRKRMLPYSGGVVLKVPKTNTSPRHSRQKQPLALVMDEMVKIATRHSYVRKCTFDSALDVVIRSECVGREITFVIDATCKVGRGARTDYDVQRVRDSADSILDSVDTVIVSEAQSVLRRAQENYASYNVDYQVRSKIGNYKIVR